MIVAFEITTSKEIKDLHDKIAARIYSMDGIESVTPIMTIEIEEDTDGQVH